MKKMIGKNIKRIVITITGVLIIVFSLLFYLELTASRYLETKVKTFAYSSMGNISYKVLVKPNILYTASSLDEGGMYLAKFVDTVRANFSYKFSGESESDIKGSYEINAVVEGYEEAKKNLTGSSSEDGKEKSADAKAIWGKEYTLVPETKMELKAKDAVFVKDVSIDYAKYNDFALNVIKLTEYNVSTRLIVKMNVNIQADTKNGIVQDSVYQYLTVPLGIKGFQITKNELLEKPGAIEEIRKVQLPVNKKLMISYGAAGVVLIIILVYLIFFTKTKPGISEHIRILNSIFKKYGNRLVALSSSSTCESDLCRMVRSIEDLVRIAEEIQKPVLYSYHPDSNFISRFFVYDDIWMYVFDIREYIRANKEEKTGTKPSGASRHHSAGDNDVKA